MQRALEWSVRCVMEQQAHEATCFITLTYNDEYNPEILIKADLQRFIKRLRRDIEPLKVKYFAGGEYSPYPKYRPHFHIILFGYDFKKDRVQFTKSERGHPIYISEQLAKLWTKGHHSIQDANKASVIYTALYSAKRQDLPDLISDYPEFNTMSQRLGFSGVLENIDEFLQTDEIYIEGKAHKIPSSILRRAFVTVSTKLKITSLSQDYKDLIEKRERKWRSNNSALAKAQDKLIIQYKLIEKGVVNDIPDYKYYKGVYNKHLEQRRYRDKNKANCKSIDKGIK